MEIYLEIPGSPRCLEVIGSNTGEKKKKKLHRRKTLEICRVPLAYLAGY